MLNNIETILVILNLAVVGVIGYILGKQQTNTQKTRMHPDYQDVYGNTIIDTDEPDYNGVILYDSEEEDTDPDGFSYKN